MAKEIHFRYNHKAGDIFACTHSLEEAAGTLINPKGKLNLFYNSLLHSKETARLA